jgi:type I restriction enzyme, S subunit
MIDGLKAYPAMKDSGVPWLGQVPEHWSVLPNRAIFSEVKDRNHPNEQMLSVTITRGVIRQESLLADSSKKDSSNLDRTAYKLVQPNDIAYNKMRAWQGAIGVSDYRGIISPAYVVMRLRGDSNPRYFHELYRTPYFAKEAERWSYGITSDMWSLRPEHFRMIYSAVPPREEQDSVVRFLDYADRRIQRYIRAKKKLIKLLDERKQGIINRAVTRGLDPNVRLKPSGVEWLGDVPEHCSILPLKRLIRRGTSISYGIVQPGPDVPEGIPFLQTSNISKPSLDLGALQHTTAEIAEAYPRSKLEGGEVVLGIRASIGAAHVVPLDLAGANLSRGIARIVPGPAIRADYLALYLLSRAARAFWDLAKQGTTFSEVPIEVVRSLPVVVPEPSIQKAIVECVAAQCDPTDRASAEIEQGASLLYQYRTRLIADVVTGKLDVREASRKLSSETREVVVETGDDETHEGQEVMESELESAAHNDGA